LRVACFVFDTKHATRNTQHKLTFLPQTGPRPDNIRRFRITDLPDGMQRAVTDMLESLLQERQQRRGKTAIQSFDPYVRIAAGRII